jgi:hypothetical protein
MCWPWLRAATLADLNEDTMLRELEVRYGKDIIYTYVGRFPSRATASG